jgi:hypothetical protein
MTRKVAFFRAEDIVRIRLHLPRRLFQSSWTLKMEALMLPCKIRLALYSALAPAVALVHFT